MSPYRMAWLLILAGMTMMLCGALAGCQTAQPPQVVYVDRIKVVRPSIAPSVLRCRPEPAPIAPTARQGELTPYVLDVLKAGRDCRRKLGTVRTRIKGSPAP